MSFSSEVKEELSKINNLANKQLVQAELIGYLASSNSNLCERIVKYSTESEYNINRFSKLLNNINIIDYDIQIQGKLFVITFDKDEIKNIVNIKNDELQIPKIEFKENYCRALLRGVFLGSGSINNPHKTYHLEMNLSSKENVEELSKIISRIDIKIKMIKDKNYYSLYIKDGEEISKFLAFLGASKAVIKFEEIRVEHQMNNKVNRLVNCENANLNKTINASVTQAQAIRYLQEIHEFEKLDETLKEIAIIRLKNPNLSLVELGKLLKNPIGKSGVNYRLNKIIEIAEECKLEKLK